MDYQTQAQDCLDDAQSSVASSTSVLPPGIAQAARAQLTQGLNSQHAVVPGEDAAEFEALRDAFLREQEPVGIVERSVVGQMVLAQWHLQRVMKTQTGVYQVFEQAYPPDSAVSLPVRLASTFLEDCVTGRGLERLSLQEARLVNLFHKCGRRLEQMQDLRRKRQAAEDASATRPKAPASPSNNSGSRENADRVGPAPEPMAPPSPQRPAPAPSKEQGGARRSAPPPSVTGAESHATHSSETASPEFADRVVVVTCALVLLPDEQSPELPADALAPLPAEQSPELPAGAEPVNFPATSPRPAASPFAPPAAPPAKLPAALPAAPEPAAVGVPAAKHAQASARPGEVERGDARADSMYDQDREIWRKLRQKWAAKQEAVQQRRRAARLRPPQST
jgi:hypothetical protein